MPVRNGYLIRIAQYEAASDVLYTIKIPTGMMIIGFLSLMPINTQEPMGV